MLGLPYPGATEDWPRRPLGEWEIPVIRFRCVTCSRPIREDFAFQDGDCWDCERRPGTRSWKEWISGVWALTVYVREEPVFPATVVVQKSKQKAALVGKMIRMAASVFKEEGAWTPEKWCPDLVVPCPSHPQAKIPRSTAMARGAGDVFDVAGQDLLRRVDPGPPRASTHGSAPPGSSQELLSMMEVAATSGNLTGEENVLLVDDVMTHGVTAGASAKALKEAGAKEVKLLVFARATNKVHLEGYCD